MRARLGFVSAACVLIAACAGAPRSADVATVQLEASRINAGQSGRAMLADRGERTDVTIVVSGVPPTVDPAVHLYTYIHRGRCGAMGALAQHALTDRVLAEGSDTLRSRKGPYMLVNTAPVPLVALQAVPHAIVVRSAPADGDRLLFCGDIGRAAMARAPR